MAGDDIRDDGHEPTDSEIAAAVRHSTPPHRPDFWPALTRRLADGQRSDATDVEGTAPFARHRLGSAPAGRFDVDPAHPGDGASDMFTNEAPVPFRPPAQRSPSRRWLALGLVAAGVVATVTTAAVVLRPGPGTAVPGGQVAPSVSTAAPVPSDPRSSAAAASSTAAGPSTPATTAPTGDDGVSAGPIVRTGTLAGFTRAGAPTLDEGLRPLDTWDFTACGTQRYATDSTRSGWYSESGGLGDTWGSHQAAAYPDDASAAAALAELEAAARQCPTAVGGAAGTWTVMTSPQWIEVTLRFPPITEGGGCGLADGGFYEIHREGSIVVLVSAGGLGQGSDLAAAYGDPPPACPVRPSPPGEDFPASVQVPLEGEAVSLTAAAAAHVVGG